MFLSISRLKRNKNVDIFKSKIESVVDIITEISDDSLFSQVWGKGNENRSKELVSFHFVVNVSINYRSKERYFGLLTVGRCSPK